MLHQQGMDEMIESLVEPPTTYREQIAILWPSKRGLRMLGYFALMYVLVSLFFLGLVFMTILFTLTLAFARLMFIFTPAYHLVGRMLGVYKDYRADTWQATYLVTVCSSCVDHIQFAIVMPLSHSHTLHHGFLAPELGVCSLAGVCEIANSVSRRRKATKSGPCILIMQRSRINMWDVLNLVFQY